MAARRGTGERGDDGSVAPADERRALGGSAQRAAVSLVLVGIASVQLGSALAATAFDRAGPAGIVLLRTLFAAAILMALRRPRPGALDRGALRDIAAFGLVLAGMNLCFYLALARLPLGIAVTFEFTGPLAVALLASRSRFDFLWTLLAAAGIVLFLPDVGDGLDPLGIVFALAAGAFWAAYILASTRVGRGPAGPGGLSLAMVVSSLLLLPGGIAAGGGALLSPELAAVGFAVAMLSSAIPYTAELEALRRLRAGTFGILLSLEPAVAALAGAVVLGQDLALRELAAVALVVVASAGALGTSRAVAPEA